MKIIIYSIIILTVFKSFSLYCYETEEIKTVGVKESPGGIWKSRREWKAHWVKEWQIRQYYVPVWKKVWGPVEVKEWIPFPHPPPSVPPVATVPKPEWNSSPLRH